MSKYNNFDDEESLSFFKKTGITLFVIFYPLFVSMYPMLPPLVGLAGYMLIVNFQKEKIYIFAPLIFLLNLDLNLSLPLFLSVFIIVIIYMFIYTRLKRLVRCKVCLLFALIVIIDFFYYFSLFIYDFIFNMTTIHGDMFLLYYFVVDILLGVLL